MKIEVKGKNIEVTDAIEIKVVDKLSRLDKYFDNPQAITAKVLVRTYPYTRHHCFLSLWSKN